jgi:hypothetical protein
MSEKLPIRASDADRERTIALLREHAVEGRLTLEEFTDRMSSATQARTSNELEALARDLPSPQGSVARRRRPTRLLFSMFSSTSARADSAYPAGLPA